MQDIAIRRAFKRLGVEFKGPDLLQVRGRHSDLPFLNPGQVEFVDPEAILQPRIFTAGWARPKSVESFW